LFNNHRQFFTFLDIKKYGADLVCSDARAAQKYLGKNSESRTHHCPDAIWAAGKSSELIRNSFKCCMRKIPE
jgi:hypothetical protein